MKTVTIGDLLKRQFEQALGHLIYVVRDDKLVFYVGQSKRDVVTRFWEHLQTPTRLGRIITLNRPASEQWAVDFYTLADCRPFVTQKSLFALQEWQHFDMDMAEQALIQALRPVINRDFNPHPTPLPAHYEGHVALGTPPPLTFSPDDLTSGQDRLWLNRMSLQGWIYERDKQNGRLLWRHKNGTVLPDEEVAPYRAANQLPPH